MYRFCQLWFDELIGPSERSANAALRCRPQIIPVIRLAGVDDVMEQSRILIVDDIQAVASMLADFLSRRGYKTDIALNGREAIEKLRRSDFDAILSDINMPDYTGLEVLKIAKEITPDTVFILITGYASLETALDGYRSGAYDYIQKPLNLEHVLMTLEEGLEKRRLTAENRRLLHALAKANEKLKQKAKALEMSVAQERGITRGIVESINDGIVMTDGDGELIFMNPAAKRILNFKEDASAKTGPLADRIDEPELAEIFRIALRKNFGSRTISKEITIDRREKNGPEKGAEPLRLCIVASLNSVRNGSGEVIGVVTVLHDLTRIREVDELKSQFLASVSHELRTPLTILENSMSIVEAAGELNDSQSNFLGVGKRGLNRLTHLINELIELSELDATGMRFFPKSVPLQKALENSIALMAAQAVDKKIELVNEVPTTPIIVYAEIIKLEQIFARLLDNAIKFTPKGGRVTINASEHILNSHTDIPPQCASYGLPTIFETRYVQIDVTDTGIGIDEKDQTRIFDSFEKIDLPVHEGAAGIGLGLPIATHLVMAHAGDIWVESKPQEGSTFSFSLPGDKKSCELNRFRRFLTDAIKRADKNDSLFSLLLIHMANFGDVQEPLDQDVVDKLYANLEEACQQKMRDDDIVTGVLGNGFLSFILHDSDQEGSRIVQRRLTDAIEGYSESFSAEMHLAVSRDTTVIVYPTAVKSEKEMLDKLVSAMKNQSKGQRM